ncbi:Transposase [Wolbachia endosymbiont of Cylisticus convexus]|nr:Transposase [Wolbachia endosymbiont of Cylisticus convexus]
MLAESEENNRRNGRNAKTLRTSAGSFELLTPRDREGSFESQIVKKRQTTELETKILSTFASGMGNVQRSIRVKLREYAQYSNHLRFICYIYFLRNLGILLFFGLTHFFELISI